MKNLYSALVLILQFLVVTVLTVRKITVVSFSAIPQNRLRSFHNPSPLRPSTIVSATQSNDKSRSSGKLRKKRNAYDEKGGYKKDFVPGAIELWRIYGITVHPDDLVEDTDERSTSIKKKGSVSGEQLPIALQKAITKKLRLESIPVGTRIVRRSLDARKKLDHPVYNYVLDVPIEGSLRHSLRWQVKPGRMEKLKTEDKDTAENQPDSNSTEEDESEKHDVVVVGMGPAGLFCALQLALNSNGKIRPILLDRGQPVEKRGQDIGKLIHRRKLNEESNFAFGEGGAGTWSDGKLTTRIGRNSDTVRLVLETLVEFGAPSNIL